MRRNDTGTPKKKTRRAAGQMVASAVMALAIAVGGFGTTALLASQPAGLTVEPSALLWEGESNADHSTKKDDKEEAPKRLLCRRPRLPPQRKRPQRLRPRRPRLLTP